MKYLHTYLASIISFFFLCLLSSCGSGSDIPSEQLVLKSLNETIKPPLEYSDLKKMDEKTGSDNGKDVYWIRFQAKLIASEDLQVFTKRGWTGMDTFYVASSDTSMLNKIHNEITATKNYNKQFGTFNKSYQEAKTYKKGDLIKEEVRGLNFKKTDKGWIVTK
ncbi:MAG TPA: hypothetical protein VFI29_22955 [Hanamia sp.]|nr:hypothetical protein [Hanamia sp.]